MMDHVDVSVVIPVYNVEAYLSECLESVLSQPGPNLEVLCIDDGSTDHSLEILREYAHKDQRIRVISQENHGLASTRNVGINQATGKYLCFVDSDDMLLPGSFHKLWRLAEESQLDMVSFETQLFYEEASLHSKRTDAYYTKRYSYSGIRTGYSYLTEMLGKNEFIDSACLLFINRHWLVRSGTRFIEGILYEDSLFSVKCYFNAKQMMHIPDQLYIYRVRKHSIMSSIPTVHNVYSNIVNFREGLMLLQQIPEQDRELRERFSDFILKNVARVQYHDAIRTDPEVMPELEPEYRLFAQIFAVGKRYGVGKRIPQDEILLAGIEAVVARSSGTILYGAGNIGVMLLTYLEERGLGEKVMGFAVTEKGDIPTQVMSKPVREIAAYQGCKQLILISAGLEFRKAMEQTLNQLQLTNYYGVDRLTELALLRYMRQKNQS